jgi:hypothetical protein
MLMFIRHSTNSTIPVFLFHRLLGRIMLNNRIIFKPIWTYRIQPWGTASTCNIEILERFQSKALRMIVDSSWFLRNMVIRTLTVKKEIPLQLSIQCSPQSTPKRPSSEPHGATRQQQATTKTPAKWSAYQIPSLIVVSVVLAFKV